jgi:hypothetical protein
MVEPKLDDFVWRITLEHGFMYPTNNAAPLDRSAQNNRQEPTIANPSKPRWMPPGGVTPTIFKRGSEMTPQLRNYSQDLASPNPTPLGGRSAKATDQKNLSPRSAGSMEAQSTYPVFGPVLNYPNPMQAPPYGGFGGSSQLHPQGYLAPIGSGGFQLTANPVLDNANLNNANFNNSNLNNANLNNANLNNANLMQSQPNGAFSGPSQPYQRDPTPTSSMGSQLTADFNISSLPQNFGNLSLGSLPQFPPQGNPAQGFARGAETIAGSGTTNSIPSSPRSNFPISNSRGPSQTYQRTSGAELGRLHSGRRPPESHLELEGMKRTPPRVLGTDIKTCAAELIAANGPNSYYSENARSKFRQAVNSLGFDARSTGIDFAKFHLNSVYVTKHVQQAISAQPNLPSSISQEKFIEYVGIALQSAAERLCDMAVLMAEKINSNPSPFDAKQKAKIFQKALEKSIGNPAQHLPNVVSYALEKAISENIGQPFSPIFVPLTKTRNLPEFAPRPPIDGAVKQCVKKLLCANDRNEYFSKSAVDNFEKAVKTLGVNVNYAPHSFPLNIARVIAEVQKWMKMNPQVKFETDFPRLFVERVDAALQESEERLCDMALSAAAEINKMDFSWLEQDVTAWKARTLEIALTIAGADPGDDRQRVIQDALRTASEQIKQESASPYSEARALPYFRVKSHRKKLLSLTGTDTPLGLADDVRECVQSLFNLNDLRHYFSKKAISAFKSAVDALPHAFEVPDEYNIRPDNRTILKLVEKRIRSDPGVISEPNFDYTFTHYVDKAIEDFMERAWIKAAEVAKLLKDKDLGQGGDSQKKSQAQVKAFQLCLNEIMINPDRLAAGLVYDAISRLPD